jgi:hypothetical protein
MCTPTHRITAPLSPLDPLASRISKNTTPDASSIPCSSCPQTHKARLAASASRETCELGLNDPGSEITIPANWASMSRRTDGASAEPLEAHDVTERETKKPRLQDAHGEHALTHHTLASQGHLARPASWDSMSTHKQRKVRGGGWGGSWH